MRAICNKFGEMGYLLIRANLAKGVVYAVSGGLLPSGVPDIVLSVILLLVLRLDVVVGGL